MANNGYKQLITRKELFEHLDNVIIETKKLEKQNPDLFTDAQILQLELRKTQPDKEILLSKLFSIEQLPSLIKEVLSIKKMLNII